MPRRLRRSGQRTPAQRWAAAAVTATAVGLIALIAIALLSASDRAVPVPLFGMGVLFPAGLGVLLALVVAQLRRGQQ